MFDLLASLDINGCSVAKAIALITQRPLMMDLEPRPFYVADAAFPPGMQVADALGEVFIETSCQKEHHRASGGQTVEGPSMSGLRILVVDDDESVLRACARILGEIPEAEIVPQKSGNAATEQLSTESFDMLISDIQIPDVSGLELTKIAHQRDPNLPVILITGYPVVEVLQGSLRLGVAACLMKPIRPDDLLATVQRVLDGQRMKQQQLSGRQ